MITPKSTWHKHTNKKKHTARHALTSPNALVITLQVGSPFFMQNAKWFHFFVLCHILFSLVFRIFFIVRSNKENEQTMSKTEQKAVFELHIASLWTPLSSTKAKHFCLVGRSRLLCQVYLCPVYRSMREMERNEISICRLGDILKERKYNLNSRKYWSLMLFFFL